MRLRIILPNKLLLDQEVNKITVPGTEGYFQLLPGHIDFVSSLKPGILSVFGDGSTVYYALNQGFLVKRANTVYISSLQAVKGMSLETLGKTVAASFTQLDEKERKTNEVLFKMEADMLRMFLEID